MYACFSLLFSSTVHPIYFTLCGSIAEYRAVSAESSMKLFEWAALEMACLNLNCKDIHANIHGMVPSLLVLEK